MMTNAMRIDAPQSVSMIESILLPFMLSLSLSISMSIPFSMMNITIQWLIDAKWSIRTGSLMMRLQLRVWV